MVTTPPVITGSYNVTTVGANNIITFWGDGTIKFPTTISVNTLIVGGGGGGSRGGTGFEGGGGGGGGGVGTGTLSLTAGTTYNITVGKEGGNSTTASPTAGGSSSIVGGSINESAAGGDGANAQNGGAGGGTKKGTGTLTYAGFSGGIGPTYASGGGGGGALTAGSNGSGSSGGKGGDGYTWSITNEVYGSGGGGGANNSGGVVGGKGGQNAANGADNLKSASDAGKIAYGGGGGGGAGGAATNGSNGGSGVVIFAIPTSIYPASLFSPGTTTPTPPPPPPVSTVTTVSKQITGTGSNIININNVDIAGTSTDGYNVFAFTKPNNTSANIAVNLSQSQVMNVFLVGGGGNGGWGGGGGGGAGGVVSQTVTLPAGNYTISVSVGNTGRSGGSRDTTITSSDGKIKYIARAGGDSTGFNPGGSRPGNGGSGAGAAWGGTMGKAGMSGIQSQYGNANADGYRSTIWAAGTGNTADYNIANPGGKGMANSDVQYNNFNCGNGGGGGAGSPGGDASLIQNIGGNDQDGNPIGPIKGGKGGDGILCTLPGIKNFTYNGKNWGQLYWAGGGGAGFSGYTYTHNAPLDYSKPTVSADGGKGGGGGGEGPWLTSDRNGPRASGNDDTNGLNPANNNNAYYLNSGKNTGGAGGLNTGGGGGGGYDSGAGGEGGSGIAIIAFSKV